jgi:hypothetical protein
MTIQWITPPSTLAKAIQQYGQRALAAAHAAAVYWGQGLQDQARQSAPWTDRTGNARSGLFFAVDGFGLVPITGEVSLGAQGQLSDADSISGSKEHLVIVLGHTVWYGKFLELSNGGRYAVVMSTIEGNLGELERMLRDLFG